MTKLTVLDTTVSYYSRKDEDYISLTDMARYRDAERVDYIIQNWMRNRNTIEFLGLWEQLNNPGFKSIEFDGFRKSIRMPSGNILFRKPLRLPTPLWYMPRKRIF